MSNSDKTSLGRVLWEQLRSRGEELALLRPGGAAGAAEIAAIRTQNLATHLAIGFQREGVEPGDRVLVASGARSEALVAELAAWMLGVVTVHVAPDTPEALLSTALERMNARWILVESRQTLGGLELANGDAVSDATIIMVEDVPKQPVSRILDYADLVEQGSRRKRLGLDELARAVFAVPASARAAIFYWEEEEDELQAAAMNHGEMLDALTPLPASWGVSRHERALIALPPGTRRGVLAPLRLLHQGNPLAFADNTADLLGFLRSVAPHLLIADDQTLIQLLDRLDKLQQESLGVRQALKRSISWLERRSRDEADESGALGRVVGRLEGWMERDLARTIRQNLGDRLRLVWCPDGSPHSDAAAVLKSAKIELVT